MTHIFFMIKLMDTCGRQLAAWDYDSMFPVIPPQFTYDNADRACPYTIEFRAQYIEQYALQTQCNLNHAIYDATQAYLVKYKAGMVK